MDRKIIAVGIAILTLVILSAGFVIPKVIKPSFNGTTYSPAPEAKEIILTDHDGQPFKLSDLRGKLVLIYFGYTNCPDECPLTMAKLKETFDLLNENGDNIQVLLVSTDPARDTPEILKSYLSKFHPSFLGVTGSEEELAKVYQDYGVTVMDDGETHSNRVYLVDRLGNLRLTFPYEMAATEIASDIKYMLDE